MNEFQLRDLLAEQLDAIEPGLVLVEKEQYIPSSLGTRSFIDITAKDARGHFVLIELKRSNASSREAIHEILKYVEAVKQHLGLRDENIRVVIASTEWKELLVPYSRFLKETDIAVEGYLIETEGGRITASRVTPTQLAAGRFIAPWHEVFLYRNQDGMERGIAEIERSMQAKDLHDYLVVVLKPDPSFTATSRATTALALANLTGDKDEADRRAQSVPDYQYMLYVATQALTDAEYLTRIERISDNMEYIREIIADLSGEELTCTLHEHLLDYMPRPYKDYFEIGYPAKFKSKIIEDEKWQIESVLRFGAFSRNPVLTDEQIIDEISGNAGNAGHTLKRSATMANKAHLASLRKDVRACLEENQAWLQQFLSQLDEAEQEFPDAEIDVQVYNPSAGLFTLYHAATDENGLRYCPTYWINVRRDTNVTRIYVGGLRSTDAPYAFGAIIDEFYDGDLLGLLLTMTWGGHESRDAAIMERTGLAYKSIRVDLSGEDRNYFETVNGGWRRAEATNPLFWVFEHFNKHEQFIEELVDTISTHKAPGGFEIRS